MSNPQKTVFISYRRSVSAFVARAIFQDLRANDYDVFMDVENIDSGTFDTIILGQIVARTHFLVICTPGTFERCAEPGDWVRLEIETAIKQKRNIIPVLIEGFELKKNGTYLTGGLSGLMRLNGLNLYIEYFEAGMVKLRDRYLKLPVVGALLPTPPDEQAAVKEKIKQVTSLPPPTTKELTGQEFFFRGIRREKDDLEGQIADLSESIKQNRDFAPAYVYRGFARSMKGDFEGAIADYDRAIQLKPKDMEAYIKRGEAYFALGEYREACQDFEAAHSGPFYSRTQAGLAIALYRLGQPDEALSYWRVLVKADSRYRDANWVGQVLHWRPELVEAANKLIMIAEQPVIDDKNAQEAVEPDPNAEAFFWQAYWREKDDLAGKITDYSEAIHLDPKYVKAYTYRGFERYQQGDLAGAIADCDKAIHLNPVYASSYSTRGRVHFALGQYQEALQDYAVTLKLDPEHKNAREGLAVTLHALGHMKEALLRWRALVKEDAHYLDADWVGKELGWRPELVEAARALIAELGN